LFEILDNFLRIVELQQKLLTEILDYYLRIVS